MSNKEKIVSRVSDTNTRQSPHNFAGRQSEGANPYVADLKDIYRAQYSLANAHFAPNPECIRNTIYKTFPELKPGFAKEQAMAKKKTQAQSKVETVMSEFKSGNLKSGGSGKKVVKRDQAIAIAMSESGQSKKKTKKKKRK